MNASIVAAWRNILYARADRFAPPRIAAFDSSLISAEPSPAGVDTAVQCPQVPGLLEQAMGTGGLPMTEDCLTLNVFAPSIDRSSLPVLVWIHGGAFTNGTGNASWYDGSALAARGCVVVTLNYRLGAFGFTGEADVGLLDQIAALQWVQRNIDNFGGDPRNVTVFGESAGGCSVLALMASPLAVDLFVRGWAMSPSIRQMRTVDRARESQRLLLGELGCTALEQAASRPTEEIVAAQARLLRDPKDIVTMFSPTIGGGVLPIDAFDRIADDARALVVGTLRDESRLWVALNPGAGDLSKRDVLSQFETRFGDAAERAWDVYSLLRPGSSPAQLLAAMQSDESFRVPAWQVIDARDRASRRTWSYFVTWETPVFGGILGACHGLDIPFVFDNTTAANVEFFIGSAPEHRHLAATLAGALVDFARSGAVPWSPTAGSRTTLQIDAQNHVLDDPERAIYDLWHS